MAQKPLRTSEPKNAAQPVWRLTKGAMPAAPRGTGAKYLLVAAVILQMAWIAALISMAMFVRWGK